MPLNRKKNRLMGRLLQLFQDNADRSGLYSIKSEGEEEATVYLYDAIGSWYGIDPQQFAKDLAAITSPTIHLRINSPGGDVFDGRAMQTALMQHPSKVIAHIDGLAASAATYVALAAEEVEISEGAFFMIHNAWTLALGNAAELRETAGLLDKVDDSIVADYRKKTGLKDDEIRDFMAAETWFSAQEALDKGFVDRIFQPEKTENKAAAAGKWNLAAYQNAPEALKNPPAEPPKYDFAAIERRFRIFENRI